MDKTQAMQRANQLCSAWLKAQVLLADLNEIYEGSHYVTLVKQAKALVEAIDTEIQYYQTKC